jgi:hypothetical protein
MKQKIQSLLQSMERRSSSRMALLETKIQIFAHGFASDKESWWQSKTKIEAKTTKTGPMYRNDAGFRGVDQERRTIVMWLRVKRPGSNSTSAQTLDRADTQLDASQYSCVSRAPSSSNPSRCRCRRRRSDCRPSLFRGESFVAPLIKVFLSLSVLSLGPVVAVTISL